MSRVFTLVTTPVSGTTDQFEIYYTSDVVFSGPVYFSFNMSSGSGSTIAGVTSETSGNFNLMTSPYGDAGNMLVLRDDITLPAATNALLTRFTFNSSEVVAWSANTLLLMANQPSEGTFTTNASASAPVSTSSTSPLTMTIASNDISSGSISHSQSIEVTFTSSEATTDFIVEASTITLTLYQNDNWGDGWNGYVAKIGLANSDGNNFNDSTNLYTWDSGTTESTLATGSIGTDTILLPSSIEVLPTSVKIDLYRFSILIRLPSRVFLEE